MWLYIYLYTLNFLMLQLFTGAMVGAGLIEDPRILLTPMNELLTLALQKY